MRINDFRLIRYGKFTDRSLQLPVPGSADSADIHLIVGPNEAGKSTLRQAIGDWLFGFPTRSPMAFLHPMPELRLGGTLQSTPERAGGPARLAFERTKGNKDTLRTPDDRVLPANALVSWLANLQREAYERMYGMDHDRLVAGGADILAASDDIGRLLFQSAAAMEHLGEALQSLEREAEALWAPRKAGSRLYYQARDEFESAGKELKQHLLRAKDWKAQHEAMEATAAQLEAARQQHQALAQQASRFERIRRVAPLLQALDAARRQRNELLAQGAVALLGEDAAALLAQARHDLALLQADLRRLAQESEQLQIELAAVPIDRELLKRAAEITELNERRLQFRAHPADLAKRTQEVHARWERVQELARALGWGAETEDAVRQRLPVAAVRSRLARLLRQRGGIDQDLRQARSQLAERGQQIAQLEHQLQALPVQASLPGLAQALDEALPFATHDRSRRDGQHKLAALADKIASALAAMGVWRQPPEALADLLAPEASTLHALQQRQRDEAQQAQSLQEAADAKTQDLRENDLALQQLVRKFQPVSLEQLQRARQTRDRLWQSIKAEPDILSREAAALEHCMAHADQLADARLERAQHEADRQASAERLEQLQLEIARLQERSAAAQERARACDAQWQALASACGLPALPLELAATWLQQRQAVLALAHERAELERDMNASDDAAHAAHHALWTALQEGSDARAALPPLAECLRQARTRIHAGDQAQGQRDMLARQLADAQAGLPALQSAAQTAQAAWEQWRSRWQAALADAAYAADADPDALETELGTLEEIERLLGAIRSTRSERIDAMQADLDSLARSAQALAARLAPDLTAQPAADIAWALAQRLEEARQAQTHAAQLQERLDKAHAQHQATHEKQQAIGASLQPLVAAAGSDDLDALASAVARSDKHRKIEQQLVATGQELARASDGYAESALREQASHTDPDVVQAELQSLARQSQALMQQIEELSSRHGSQKAALDALDGTSRAARAEARRQEAIATMADAMQRYTRLSNASRLLRWSIEKFRQTRQGPMLAQASSLLRTLTQGAFDRLVVDGEGSAPRLIGVRRSGEQVEVAGMSEGTRDQLYLALRLAALQLQSSEGLALPFIADDLFINFDEQRTHAGLKVLGQLARQQQVIVLTHHEHLVDLARDALGPDVNVVRM
ncbi:MAG: AAA family ATPase [Burkholderiaceae bacterium]|nr:AAA family ATPase [Burkholderiaceae bacterium]